MTAATAKISKSKQDAVSSIKGYIEKAKDLIFTDFRGMNVVQITELRNKLRQKEAEYKVIRNNYTKIAMAELGFPDVSKLLFGPTALALVKKDAGSVAKTILDFTKKASVKVKGAVIDGKLFSLDEVKALSKLPSKDQLVAVLLSTMNVPIQNLVYGLKGVIQNLVRTLQAIADKKSITEKKKEKRRIES